MAYWILILLSLLITVSASGESYECGPHGKFEYCIDGIPGCVIGCHCHPGYYFDTDTKICEPNVKLTQYRRKHAPEPTRIQIPVTPIAPVPAPTPTPQTNIDNKVDEIAKDADDLGDWLYNQFFKTIENQVINKTDDGETLTRRSGRSQKRKPKRLRRKGKSNRKKKNKHKGNLKKKLLRITEDDSLFDSSSSSTSDSDSSDSSSTSTESDTSTEKEKEEKDDEHGHRKIIMFNKKPKAPLPSFIFLPNMDTPFYPPIGLPPPPVVPMYPMVPVPPVPMYPFPGLTPHWFDGDSSSTTAAATSPPGSGTNGGDTTTTGGNGADTTTPGSNGADTSPPPPPSLPPSNGAGSEAPKADVKPDTPPTAPPNANTNIPEEPKKDPAIFRSNNHKLKANQRNKFLQRLKDKMKKRNKKPPNHFVNYGEESEIPYFDEMLPQEPLLYNEIQSKVMEENMQKPEDVDFKYLTQLIHRMNLNNTTNDKPPHNNDVETFGPLQTHRKKPRKFQIPADLPKLPTRRFNRRESNFDQQDDTYYSNLGRQIATLIRKIDSKGERQVNIEIEANQQAAANHPIFNENSYGSRSYWERSVRSPLKTFYLDPEEFEYIKNSNEHLFALENKAKSAVSSSPALSLQELENIITTIRKTKSMISKQPIRKSNDSSNRLNMMPQNDKEFRTETTSKKYINGFNIHYDIKNERSAHKPIEINTSKINLHKRKNITSASTKQSSNETSSLRHYPEPPSRRIMPAQQYIGMVKAMSHNGLKLPRDHLGKIMGLADSHPQNTKILHWNRHINPNVVNYKNLKYYLNDNTNYLFEKTFLPLKVSNHIGKPKKPSYFHHELHHFDYFD